MTADLITWLGTQLDADEQIARAATPGAWSSTSNRCVVNDAGRRVVASVAAHDCWPSVPDAAFIAANDPERVLRTVAAHRAILNLALATEDRSLHADAWWVGQEMIRQLASIYEGRDGWDPAWKVGP